MSKYKTIMKGIIGYRIAILWLPERVDINPNITGPINDADLEKIAKKEK